MKGKKILLTCGPTWVAIDDIRVISNRSTGQLGHLIAGLAAKEGAKVTMLEGPVIHPFTSTKVKTQRFFFYEDLKRLLKQELTERYDIVIHAAAVSDYRPAQTYGSKLSSGFSKLKLVFVPTEKIINRVKALNPGTFLVGFKLETNISKDMLSLKAFNLMKTAGCDLVVANTHKSGNYYSLIIDRDRNTLATNDSREETARNLINILKTKA